MTEYWIVVRRGEEDIRQTLELAFREKTAFTIIEDRRQASRRVPLEKERRQAAEILTSQHFIVAERRRDW